jgi:hypothetical protein
MAIAVLLVACSLYRKSVKNEANDLVLLSQESIKSHEDIEIDIKTTEHKK